MAVAYLILFCLVLIVCSLLIGAAWGVLSSWLGHEIRFLMMLHKHKREIGVYNK